MKAETIFSFQSKISDRKFPLRLVRMSPQDPTAMHRHEFTEIVIIYGGKGGHITGEGKSCELKRGDVFIVSKGHCHQYRDGNLELINLIFESDFLPLPFLDTHSIPYFNMILNGDKNKTEILKLEEDKLQKLCIMTDALEKELLETVAGYRFAALAIFMQILIFLSRTVITDDSPKTIMFHDGISKTMEYMHRHFREEIYIDKLAYNAGMSMSSLLRHFKNINGISPKEYLLNLRIANACDLLASSSKNMDDIAMQAGFNCSNYFSRIFKKTTGLTPSQYRETSQKSRR